VLPEAPAAADGRDWKYSGRGSPFLVVNAWPMSEEPTALPLRSMIEPSALSLNASCPIPRTTSGKPMPRITVKMTMEITEGRSWRRIT
jgi:hypothetical protein